MRLEREKAGVLGYTSKSAEVRQDWEKKERLSVKDVIPRGEIEMTEMRGERRLKKPTLRLAKGVLLDRSRKKSNNIWGEAESWAAEE